MVCPYYTAVGGCDEATFSAAVKDPLQICDTEVTAAFVLLSIEDPASDTTLIDLSDLTAWRNTIIDDYNTGGIYIFHTLKDVMPCKCVLVSNM